MTGIDARPRSATEIVDSAFNILRQRYSAFVTASAIMYIPVLLLTLGALGAGTYPVPGKFSGANFVTPLLQLVWMVLTNSVLAIMTSQVFVGGEADAGAAIRLALRRSWSILLAGAVTTLMFGFGAVFLVIPGVYLFARFGMSPVVAAIEGTGPIESLSRASGLSKDNKRHYLATLSIVFILYFIVSSVAGVIAALASVPAVSIVAGAAISVFLLPFVGTVQALIYFDLRIRNEGYDIELMSDRLAAPAVATAG